jgi:DNA modification methylase
LSAGHADKALELGTGPTLVDYVARLVAVLEEVRRVLRPDGTLWLNLGDSYVGNTSNNGGYSAKSTLAGFTNPNTKGRQLAQTSTFSKRTQDVAPKNLLGVPWRVAFALQDAGWYLRSDCIWHKPNPMPESVTDRPTRAHEYLFLLAKSERYYYDAGAIAERAIKGDQGAGHRNYRAGHEQGRAHEGMTSIWDRETRNKRSVWTVATSPYPEAHFATFPEALVEPCILAGSAAKACEHCGAPWERLADRLDETPASFHGSTFTRGKTGINAMGRGSSAPRGTRIARGLSPACACPDNRGTASSLVLDPFAGSGTVLAVATRLRRRAVGIELNPDYLPLIERRIAASCPEARGQGVLALEEVS